MFTNKIYVLVMLSGKAFLIGNVGDHGITQKLITHQFLKPDVFLHFDTDNISLFFVEH